MGFLKRIFGQDNPVTDKQIESDVEQIKSGQISKIYPILKPGDWVGLKTGAVRQLRFGTEEEPILVVAFGYNAPNNFVFLTYKDLEKLNPEEVRIAAYENIDNYHQEFEISNKYNGRILFASGQDFSSEKILCKEHMLKAHKLLNSEELYVSIPRRRCMMIMSTKESDELLQVFATLHKKAWLDNSYGNAPILDAFFRIREGEIFDMIPLYKM